MSYIQLPYGFCKNSEQIQFNLPKNYEASQYIKRLPYITNKDPDFDNEVIDLINNREYFKKWLLATSYYGDEIQEDLKAIVGYDEKFNNVILRHALDVKDFDMANPILCKLATQVKASKLTKDEITKKN